MFRANGNYAGTVDKSPFMLSASKHEDLVVSGYPSAQSPNGRGRPTGCPQSAQVSPCL